MILGYAAFLILLLFTFQNIESTFQIKVEKANKIFAGNILKEIVSLYNQQNFIVSPYFIQRALLLAIVASKKPLNHEILNTIQLRNVKQDKFIPYFENYPKNFLNNDHMFYKAALHSKPLFTLIAEKYFGFKPLAVKFLDTEETTGIINKIVEQETKLFREFLSADFLQRSESVLFVNTVSFSGQWEMPFNIENNRIGKFYDYTNKQAAISCIYGIRRVGYADLPALNAAAVQLPYKNSSLEMLILLPNPGAKDLNWENFEGIAAILDALEMQNVGISLPSFQLETHIDLGATLQHLGLKTFFGPEARFLNAFQEFPANLEAKFLHGARLEVTEYGSNVKLRAQKDIENVILLQSEALKYLAPQRFFVVNRPFVIILHSNDVVHMVGRIAALNSPSVSNVRITKPEVNEELR